MADDIVTRLRELMADLLYNPDCDDEGCGDCAWHRIGADAIDEIERLRAAGDALDAALEKSWRECWCACEIDTDMQVVAAFADWQKARRG